MSRIRLVRKNRVIASVLLIGVLAIYSIHFFSAPAFGAQLGNRTLKLSSSNVGDTATYDISFSISTAGIIGSMDFRFCSNSPFPGDPCTVPPGFSALHTSLVNQLGVTGFTIDPSSSFNNLILTRVPNAALTGPASYTFDNIVNPSQVGSYFVRLQTFATNDTTGPASDYGGIAFAITNNITISAEVPPYLTFCTAQSITGLNCANASGQYVDLGEFSPATASSGTSQFLVATNAKNGYAVSVYGPTMASGINPINQMAAPDISRPGISQFGMNLRGNTTPANGSDPIGPGSGQPTAAYDTPDEYAFNSGDEIATNAGTELTREYTVTYLVNVPSTQPPGIYVTTLTYVCIATF